MLAPRGCDHPTVQLLHEMPDGSGHVDWMLGRDPDGVEPLVTFRVARRLDTLAVASNIDAERIADHRPVYLAYEGPVNDAPGGAERSGPSRGIVTRLSTGRIIGWERDPDAWRIEIVWFGREPGPLDDAPPPHRLRLEDAGGGRWRIKRLG